MTTKTPTTPRRARRSMLFPLSRDQLLPPELEDLPASIVEANRIAAEAMDRVDEAWRKAGELASQAKAAPRFDQLATEAAIAAGEKPPKPTTGRKQAAAEEARKQAEAAEQVAKQRVRELYDRLEDDFPAYRAARRADAEQAVAPLRSMPAEFLELWIAARSALELHHLAEDWHNNPNSAAISPGTERTDRLRQRYQRELERQRGMRSDGASIIERLAGLTAELERELDGR